MTLVACNNIQMTHWAICCLQLLHATKLPSVSPPLGTTICGFQVVGTGYWPKHYLWCCPHNSRVAYVVIAVSKLRCFKKVWLAQYTIFIASSVCIYFAIPKLTTQPCLLFSSTYCIHLNQSCSCTFYYQEPITRRSIQCSILRVNQPFAKNLLGTMTK